MALLPVEKRKQLFSDIGYTYDKQGILSFQKRYMLRRSDYDGIYGPNTENTLLTVWRVRKFCKNFKPEEFVCGCRGRYCCGYPAAMQEHELIHIQAIRDHWGKPVTITCGLRCPTYNRKVGGISNSSHKTGKAVDFYQKGVTDPLSNRKKSIAWIKKQKYHAFTYGNGIDSNGVRRSAPGMGNCLHTDTE